MFLKDKLSALVQTFLPSKLNLTGKYLTYSEALEHCEGYDHSSIIDKVEYAVSSVLEGKSKYERDGVTFDSIPSKLPIYSVLFNLISSSKDCNIVDFGGGLGGLYINNTSIFHPNSKLTVIEQPKFVEIGENICRQYKLPIIFCNHLSELSSKPDIVILSSVLQYIPNPYEIIDNIARLQPSYIILDRTSFGVDKYWRIQVNSGFYDVDISYPHHLIDESKVLSLLKGYSVAQKWTNSFDPVIPRHYGLLLSQVK
jgi:putative methyltransferase (TIGR04325 family)